MVLDTTKLTIPDQILDPWLGKIQGGSVVSTLSQSTPMLFGAGESITFDIGEAEYVGEGQAKGETDIEVSKFQVGSFKFHKTLRFNQEVLWADEDHQLRVVQTILNQLQPKLSRALDFGVLHGVNPLNGAKVSTMPNLDTLATKSVEYDAAKAAYVSVDAADALVLASGYVPRDLALDGMLAGRFATARNAQTEQKLYPAMSLGTAESQLEGHRLSVSDTVGARKQNSGNPLALGYVGDFSAIQWGLQKELGLETIEWGDPDGQGDLKRNNQVAFRVEVVYGWGIADEGKPFVRIVDAA